MFIYWVLLTITNIHHTFLANRNQIAHLTNLISLWIHGEMTF